MLFTVLKLARAFALDILKTSDRVSDARLLQNFNGYGASVGNFDLIQSFSTSNKMKLILNGYNSRTF